MRRSTAVPAALLAACALLLAGCGEDADDADPSPAPSTSAGESDAAPTDAPTTASGAPSASADDEPGASEDAGGNGAKVDEVADKLGCEAEPGVDGFEGETEHTCGPYLIVDWTTAGVTEQEMFSAIDAFVDEARPVWLYTGDLVLVYGTRENLDAVSEEFFPAED